MLLVQSSIWSSLAIALGSLLILDLLIVLYQTADERLLRKSASSRKDSSESHLDRVCTENNQYFCFDVKEFF